jgi:hypothetical protein
LTVKFVKEGGEWRILALEPNLTAADAGHAFVQLLAKGKTHEAYLAAAPELRSGQSEAEFTAAVKKLGLAPSQVISDFSSKGDFDLDHGGTLFGTASPKNGKDIPLMVKFVNDGDGLYVQSVEVAPAGSKK